MPVEALQPMTWIAAKWLLLGSRDRPGDLDSFELLD
jgi:hypothetical protein